MPFFFPWLTQVFGVQTLQQSTFAGASTSFSNSPDFSHSSCIAIETERSVGPSAEQKSSRLILGDVFFPQTGNDLLQDSETGWRKRNTNRFPIFSLPNTYALSYQIIRPIVYLTFHTITISLFFYCIYIYIDSNSLSIFIQNNKKQMNFLEQQKVI